VNGSGFSRYRRPRRYPRVSCQAPLYVEQIGDGDFQGFSRTHVLGEGGCMFVSPTKVGFLSLLKLSILLDGRVLAADGRVAYELPRERSAAEAGEVEVGVEFLRMSALDRAHLRARCGNLEKDQA
jgi:hypothetical protein